MHSSRVGVSTSPWTSCSPGLTYWSIGSPNAAVLPGPGLGLTDHVVALEQRRDRLLLNRARRLVPDVVDGLEDVRLESKVGKTRHYH